MSHQMTCPRCWGSTREPLPAPTKPPPGFTVEQWAVAEAAIPQIQADLDGVPYTRPACGHCLGVGVVADLALSTHFLLSELLHSEAAVRLGLPNDPPPGYVDRLRLVCEQLLEPLHDRFGRLHVNSGLRLPAVNQAIGGSATSAHVEAYAADLKPLEAGVRRRDLVDWLASSGVPFDQVIFEGTWVHVGLFSPSGAQRRGVLMMFPGANGKPEYFPYDPADPRVAG